MKSQETDWKRTKSQIEALWERTACVVSRFFDACECPLPGEAPEKSAPSSTEEASLPRMTEFNVIVAAIKRMQEARIALIKEEERHASHEGGNQEDTENAHREISRILEALEKSGAGEDDSEDSM